MTVSFGRVADVRQNIFDDGCRSAAVDRYWVILIVSRHESDKISAEKRAHLPAGPKLVIQHQINNPSFPCWE